MNEALPKTRNRLIRIWRNLTDKGEQAWAAFKTISRWSWRVLRTPTDRLSYRVERWIKDWNRTNPARYKRAYPSLTLLLSLGHRAPGPVRLTPLRARLPHRAGVRSSALSAHGGGQGNAAGLFSGERGLRRRLAGPCKISWYAESGSA